MKSYFCKFNIDLEDVMDKDYGNIWIHAEGIIENMKDARYDRDSCNDECYDGDMTIDLFKATDDDGNELPVVAQEKIELRYSDSIKDKAEKYADDHNGWEFQ